MPVGTRRRRPGHAAIRALAACSLAICACAAAACGGPLAGPEYEYEEDLSIGLDGSATLNVYGSIAALVALRGVDLPLDPRARVDRQQVRALFEHPGAEVAVSLSRRDGRRFVHARIDVDDVSRLSAIAPLSWSRYRLARRDDVVEYVQAIGEAAGAEVGDVGWTGDERVRFRMHVPSEILFHNSRGDILRGNILEWEQPLAARRAGQPLELVVHMAPESILQTTLLLFGATILAAAATFGGVLWWVARRGRGVDLAESHP
jgi:hypothetical protein